MNRSTVVTLSLLILLPLLATTVQAQTDNDTCLMCHDDKDLEADDGRLMNVSPGLFEVSVHGDLECIDCHSHSGDFDDVPHWSRYQQVDCSECHDTAVESFHQNFHFKALDAGNREAPDCASCHAREGDPHRMQGLHKATAEEACRQCHKTETDLYDSGVHAARADQVNGKPGCVTCHQSHGPGLPPSAGAVNSVCQSCHEEAMHDVARGGHTDMVDKLPVAMNCASCHDVHGTHKPHMSERMAQACNECHAEEQAQFTGSVHEDLLADGDMTCLSCHSTHKDEEAVGRFDGGCGTCHDDVEETYRGSVHRFGRLHGNEGAATCADCHDGHHVLTADSPESPINPNHIQDTCGECHGEESVITNNFVRLPITLLRYQESVHSRVNGDGNPAATCVDCHGTHDLQHSQNADSGINRTHLARTCGKCHEQAMIEYQNSIHGQALAVGIADAPTCNDCHDEHLTRSKDDEDSMSSANHVSRDICGTCHLDAELVAKYGITPGVVESYMDSYHAWAREHGGRDVATCVDCHNTHEIRSPLDPVSWVHPDNVTTTCGQCHKRSNEAFARSYTHASALAARGPHEWAKFIYIILISVVLGGMAIHNAIIWRYELIKHRQKRKTEDYVERWQKVERMQHLVLLTSFTGLAITGFALRMSDAWWVNLIGLGGHEYLRATLHRCLAIILTFASFYHAFWLAFTQRGRMNLRTIVPMARDFVEFPQNMMFHLGIRKERPDFHRFDYTQKAEYWAVIWGTIVMALTGLILWFPDLFTSWMPSWVIRVSSVVHYLEAILAVSAIIIWHFFYVLWMPSEYPMSTIWLDGKMPSHEWKTMHPGERKEEGDGAIQKGEEPESE